jgi:hypothetical protein
MAINPLGDDLYQVVSENTPRKVHMVGMKDRSCSYPSLQ